MLNDITITWVLVYYKCFCMIGTDSIVCVCKGGCLFLNFSQAGVRLP